MDANKKIDRSKLTPDQLDRLDNYNNQMAVITRLKDLGDMTQEVVLLLDSQKTEAGDNTKQMAALLLDMRDSLQTLTRDDKKTDDEPILNALSKLEKSLTAAVAKIDVKPNVSVAAPDVTVTPTPVDLSAIEKLLKNDIPKAFKEALKGIPQPKEGDFGPLLDAWQGISEQLVSIENATRMKPLPGTMKVTNPDGSLLNSQGATELTADLIAEWTEVLYEVAKQMTSLAATRDLNNVLRVGIVSGTVSSVSTLSNITSIGGYTATPLISNGNNQTAIQSNINNVIIT